MRCALFDEAHLLEGENAASYRELLAHIREAVRPIDIIDEMLIADVASLEWEILRWRRLKTILLRARGLNALQQFLREKLDYEFYAELFVEHLTQILQENLPQDRTHDAQRLAQECAPNKGKAIDKVNEILGGIGQSLDGILNRAQAAKAGKTSRKLMLGTTQRPSSWSMNSSPGGHWL